MNWTQSHTLALAKQTCVHCMGLGMLQVRRGDRHKTCTCVEREIFRICYRRFMNCANSDGRVGQVSLEGNPARQRKGHYSLKSAEYLADFILIAKRTLGEDTPAYQLFKFHFLLGADWKLCTRRLGMSRGDFFHEVYRIQQKLGKAYRETEPFSLFPLDEYFGGISAKHERPAAVLPLAAASSVVRFPLRATA